MEVKEGIVRVQVMVMVKKEVVGVDEEALKVKEKVVEVEEEAKEVNKKIVGIKEVVTNERI